MVVLVCWWERTCRPLVDTVLRDRLVQLYYSIILYSLLFLSFALHFIPFFLSCSFYSPPPVCHPFSPNGIDRSPNAAMRRCHPNGGNSPCELALPELCLMIISILFTFFFFFFIFFSILQARFNAGRAFFFSSLLVIYFFFS